MNKFIFIVALTVFSNFANALSHQDIWDAAKDKRWEEVRNVISSDPSAIDYTPSEGAGRGVNVLWIAAWYNQWDLVRAMLQNNPTANIDTAPEEGPRRGVTVLWIAAWYNQWDLVRAMLQNNPTANIDTAPEEGPRRGEIVLWLAAARKQWDLVRIMLQNNPHANIDAAPEEGPRRGMTVLWFAAVYKQWDLVRIMLQNRRRANIDAAPEEGPRRGQTVLWIAAACHQWALVRTTLQYNPKANIDASPLEGRGRGASVLFNAVQAQQWDLVRTMLQNNPKANSDAASLEDDLGVTVLWIAAWYKQWDLVRIMLRNNPKANSDAAPLKGPYRGATVLWWAAADQQWDLVRTMLQNNPTANIDASPLEGINSPLTILNWAARSKQWELLALMLQGDPSVLVKRAFAILSLVATTPSVTGAALATLLLHADNLWEDITLLAKLTASQRNVLNQIRAWVEEVALNCLRSWKSQDDSLLTHSLLPREIQFQIALHTMRTHHGLKEFLPDYVLMPLLQAQLQKNNREWLARETTRQAFAQRFPFAAMAPTETLDSPCCWTNIEATVQVIRTTLSGDFKPDAFTRVEAMAFAKEAATHIAGLNEFTPENIKVTVQNAKKRASEEECPPAKRQIGEQIKDPLKSRQGTRRTGERANFDEQEIAQDIDVSDPLLSALGLNRAAAIELILGVADDGAIRTLVATEIRRAALARQLPSVMQAPMDLNAEALREWAMRRDTFENYVAAVLGHQDGRIGYYFATVGLLGALAQLTHTHLTIWLPETDTQEVHQAYEAGEQGHRRIDLLHTNGMTDFTLLTPEQAIVPMAVNTMAVVRVVTPTTPLSRSAALVPAPNKPPRYWGRGGV